MSDIKRRESLRCLFASLASIKVIDWLLQSDHFKNMIANAEDIDERLANIRSFFVSGMGLTRKDVQNNMLPIWSVLVEHIYGVLFADAVRWWAAAHRTGRDENKYLRDAMYKGEFVAPFRHFYHDFRNNQLAHFPGGPKSNDNPFLTPAPYGFLLSQKEYDDFRSLLTHSIKLAMVSAEKLDELAVEDLIRDIESSDASEELKVAAVKVMRQGQQEFDAEILKIPTRSYLPDEHDE